jgi:KUP system potassium uptake protein
MNKSKFTTGGSLIALGIVFGDIGTSPLYVLSAITHSQPFSQELVLGSLSCIIWTLLLLATGKYVLIALNTDNHGEGGIFALYARLKDKGLKWIIIPALLGCATLLADGFITPAISISSAVEGLNVNFPNLPTIPIVVIIISGLFFIQQFGTESIGKYFGPIMIVWFAVIGSLGFYHIVDNPEVLVAINPMHAVKFLVHYPTAIWLMGAVFLCTTGAEAMYSDLGHIGKQNIRGAWIFVIICLAMSYLGQGAFLLKTQTQHESVFYSSVPKPLINWVIGIATMATIIASQALITGVFTLVSEAIKLRLWTNLKIKYPATEKGQVYVPAINTILFIGCLVVVALFKKSTNMEGAYGLAISIDMLMTSSLLFAFYYLSTDKWKPAVLVSVLLFVGIEIIFFISNLAKFNHGGWFPLLVSLTIFTLLLMFYKARMLRNTFQEFTKTGKLQKVIESIQTDEETPYDFTNLIYFTRSINLGIIEKSIVHSLTLFRPKKARFYWFLHINVTDKPRGITYSTREMKQNSVYFLTVNYGFKEEHHIEYLMRKVFKDLKLDELADSKVFKVQRENALKYDFKFLIINTKLASINKLSPINSLAVRIYRIIKKVGLSSEEDFGLHPSVYETEYYPLVLGETVSQRIQRISSK